MLTIATVCEHEVWSGFFGIDQYGNQPFCHNEITLQVEEECVSYAQNGTVKTFTVKCPKCGGLIEDECEWEIVYKGESHE